MKNLGCFIVLLVLFHPCRAQTAPVDTARLDSITVTAKKPLVVRKTDRFVVNVENSFLANGNTALEVLQKIPGVWVDQSGSIRIKGSQTAVVMIDNVVQRMSDEELAAYLSSLRSEDISRIEVIPNPPASFEASGTGGILHIVLKKNRKSGFNGSLWSQYRQQGSLPYTATGASIDYKIKNIYFFASASAALDRNSGTALTRVTYADQSANTTAGDRRNRNSRQQYRIGAAADLSSTQNISLQLTGNKARLLNLFHTIIDMEQSGAHSSGAAFTNWLRRPENSSLTFNYTVRTDTAGSSFRFIADYTTNHKSETSDFVSGFDDSALDLQYRNHAPGHTGIYSMQADYDHAAKTATSFGLKYVSTERTSGQQRENMQNGSWVNDPAATDSFVYNETLLMAYGSAERKWNRTDVKAGLRVEQSFSHGRSLVLNERFRNNYPGFFPSFFLVEDIGRQKGNTLYFNYSRRIRRPAFTELNPYRLQFDNYTVMIGNPGLSPEYAHNFELGANTRKGLSANVYFNLTKGVIAQLANPIGNHVIEYQYRNFSSGTEYGCSLSAPVTIARSWSATNNLTMYRSAYAFNEFHISRTTFSARTTQTVSLKGLADIDAIAEYSTPRAMANTRLGSIFYMDIGLSKRVLSGKVKLRFYASDVFNTVRETELTDYNGAHIDFSQKRQTRNFSIFVGYYFSKGKKFKAKTIQASNEEEKNRL